MVNGALSLGGFVGVLLSGAFIFWEVGRYAAPQVPRSLFDERKEVFAYTAGLFVGVPMAFVLLLLTSAIANGALIAAVIDLVILVGAIEVAQALLVRSYYFGRSESTPFYALGFRAGIGGILILGAVTAYLGGLTITAGGVVFLATESVALLAIQVNGALVSFPRPGEATGGPFSGILVGLAGMAVLSLGLAVTGLTGAVAGLLVLAALIPSYRRLRRRVLGRIHGPATQSGEPEAAAEDRGDRPFGRTGP
jgi:hypothetical protein